MALQDEDLKHLRAPSAGHDHIMQMLDRPVERHPANGDFIVPLRNGQVVVGFLQFKWATKYEDVRLLDYKLFPGYEPLAERPPYLIKTIVQAALEKLHQWFFSASFQFPHINLEYTTGVIMAPLVDRARWYDCPNIPGGRTHINTLNPRALIPDVEMHGGHRGIH
jgi:hypothetical protein